MPAELPYLSKVGNIPAIMDRIREAGTPPKFTLEFLSKSLGFTSSQDRGMIRVLKQLGFLSADGTPSQRYNDFRSSVSGGQALAAGLREGWAPIFLSDQRAPEKSVSQLTETFKSVTGSGESVAQKAAQTFKQLASKADWAGGSAVAPSPSEDSNPKQDQENYSPPPPSTSESGRVNLHHDIHVHLPPTSDVAVYRAIFQALREELL